MRIKDAERLRAKVIAQMKRYPSLAPTAASIPLFRAIADGSVTPDLINDWESSHHWYVVPDSRLLHWADVCLLGQSAEAHEILAQFESESPLTSAMVRDLTAGSVNITYRPRIEQCE